MNQQTLTSLIVRIAFLFASISVETQTPFTFVDNAENAGIVFQHFDGGGSKNYLPQLMMTGLALFDFDGDGWTDIYFLNGHELSPEREKPAARTQQRGNTLYRNNRDGTFDDVTQ